MPNAADRENGVVIVMYHYVRAIASGRYPGIKGLELAAFHRQLRYIRKNFTVITAEELMTGLEACADGRPWDIPKNAALLTFDDGYVDHFANVFPALAEEGIQGSFFPAAMAVEDRVVLDVNKIQFVLALQPDVELLLTDLRRAFDLHRGEFQVADFDSYVAGLDLQSRFDSREVTLFKRMLQKALPARLRQIICEELFRKHVSADEQAFAAELYMSSEHLLEMSQAGMYIGSHGYNHFWLSDLKSAEQEREIDASLRFLAQFGLDKNRWIMCYPFGDSNESLRSILRARGCKVGLTTRVGVAHAGEDPLLLPRLDTNDLPVDEIPVG